MVTSYVNRFVKICRKEELVLELLTICLKWTGFGSCREVVWKLIIYEYYRLQRNGNGLCWEEGGFCGVLVNNGVIVKQLVLIIKDSKVNVCLGF